jgi:hypothetical protein
MFKFLKELKEYKTNKVDYERFLSKQSALLEYELEKGQYETFKQEQLEFEKYKSIQDRVAQYMEKNEAFDDFLTYGESFRSYKAAVGDTNQPFFLMYASDIDAEGNVAFSYDFSPEFAELLRRQGIQGIEDLEVIEAYLHFIFSQNYFSEMFKKDDEK